MSSARWFHLVTFCFALAGVLLQLVLVVQGHNVLDETNKPDPGTRLIRFCSYLTIWGNVLAVWSSGNLALGRDRDSKVWRALRLDTVVLMAVIAIVHFFFLRPLLQLHGWDLVADKLLHMVVPALVVLGWLLFGPRSRAAVSDLAMFLVIPLAWLGYTLVRGAIVDWYPYPFINVTEHGYAVVLVNCAGVAALMLVLAFAALRLDGWLTRVRSAS